MTSELSNLRQVTESDSALILTWRNHPDIRKWMYSSAEISAAEHDQWFKMASADPTRTLLIYSEAQMPLGFLNFKELSGSRVAEWGFYTSPDAPKGTGAKMGTLALKYAFEQRNFRKIFATVLDFNVRSIRYHLRLGFKEEGILRSHHFDGETYHDVHCFGLLQDEWRETSQAAF